MEEHQKAVLEAALDVVRRGEAAALATVIEAHGSAPRSPGAKMLVCADGRTVGSVGGGSSEAWVIDQALKALAEGRPRLLERPSEKSDPDACGRSMRFFVDVLLPPPTLLIIGAGHIGRAVASLGAWLGYRITVLDERAEFVSDECQPHADVLLSGPPHEKLSELPLTDQTYVVLVTPHDAPDEKVLSVLADHPIPYVGLLGSTRRTRATFRRARDLGVPSALLKRVRAPVGLEILAETPREIALSVLAEITAVRRRGN